MNPRRRSDDATATPVAADPPAVIPDDHPRAASLRVRERLAEAVASGLVHPTGLIAHGRGEAFDYLIGETTMPEAQAAIEEAARRLAAARHPVLSLNGNVVALAARECVALAAALPRLTLEVNLFHRSPERVARLVAALEAQGAAPGTVLGREPDFRIPGLSSKRALCCRAGIGEADVVLVPLEDGDRCHALKAMGKVVITIDLNPLSRTARTADVTIVDEVTRALPRLAQALREQGRAAPRSPGDPGRGGPGAGTPRDGDPPPFANAAALDAAPQDGDPPPHDNAAALAAARRRIADRMIRGDDPYD